MGKDVVRRKDNAWGSAHAYFLIQLQGNAEIGLCNRNPGFKDLIFISKLLSDLLTCAHIIEGVSSARAKPVEKSELQDVLVATVVIAEISLRR